MKYSLLFILLLSLLYANAQTNNFPLYSNGAYSGGSGDGTNAVSPHLKLQSSSDYVRVIHLGVSSSVSAVYNYQTGKNAYWGESTDAGQYIFRGRDMILQEGKFGIGTTPTFALDVSGNGTRIKNNSTTTADYTTFRLQGPDYTNGLEIDFFGNNNISSDPNWTYGGGIGSVALVNVNAKPMTFATSNLGRMIIDAAGNVGIGTFSPNQKLTVNGTIYGKEVKVDLSVPGPDYVFEKSYALPSLEEVKSYIDENKHLPDVPSAKEMEVKGIDVGEMNMLLLKKVEELTLYVIELKKLNNDLEKRVLILEK